VKLRKIAPNFGRFLPSHILRGQSPKKLYPRDHACLAARHLEKLSEVAPPNPKVIGAHTPNFKPIFECSSLKVVGGPPSSVECALGSLGHSQAPVKISAGSAPQGPKYSHSYNLTLGGSTCAPITFFCSWTKRHQIFFRRTWEEAQA